MKFFVSIIIILCLGVFVLAPFAQAQSPDKIMMSISPPLIKNNVNPGQLWKSQIKLVNNNSKELTVYVQAIDFKGGKENGTVEFVSTEQENEESSHLLSKWLKIDSEPITIPPFSGQDIPFIIDVPENAEPGGHYAALLVGTKPLNSTDVKGASIKISSLLASLILLNVDGDIEESGLVREFSTDKKIYSKAQADFTLRFQNTGNVHLLPQGEIRIVDMFNNDQGSIAINQNTDFGNVLPKEIRKWNFDWSGSKSVLAMGRYKAILILQFGEKSRETTTATLFFWVINWKIILFSLLTLGLIIFIIIFLIKRYIKRAIIKTQKFAEQTSVNNTSLQNKIDISPESKKVVNLKIANQRKKEKASLKESKQKKKSKNKWLSFRLFTVLLFVIIFVIVILLGYFYYKSINKDKISPVRTEINLQPEKSAEEQSISSTSKETITKLATSSLATSTTDEAEKEKSGQEEINISDLSIAILNGSGRAGLANQVAANLRSSEFNIERTGNAENFDYVKTQILYKKGFKKQAELIADILNRDIEIKASQDKKQKEEIIIIIGSNW